MSLIQSAAVVNSSGNANNIITLNDVVAGSLLILCVGFAQQTNGNPPTVAGWKVAQNPAGQIFLGVAWTGSCIFYLENAPAGTNTATIVPGTSATLAAMSSALGEFTTGFSSNTLDKSTSNRAASGTSGNTETTLATGYPNEIVVCALAIVDVTAAPHANCGISTPASASYTSLGVHQDTTTTGIGFEASYKFVTSTGTQIGSWTWTDSSAYIGTIATFRDSLISANTYYTKG